jgi:Na+/H+ antiporter NhaD/arsenite permease-like protein
MDDIDITSAEYTISDIANNIITGGEGEDFSDSSMYIYIGISIFVLIVLMLLYKFYGDRNKRVTFQDKLDDCYGDVCHRDL